MRIMTASEASRSFSAVLDETEHGETIVVTRGGRRVAMISPTATSNGAALLDLARQWNAPDDPEFPADVESARATAEQDEDPWARA